MKACRMSVNAFARVVCQHDIWQRILEAAYVPSDLRDSGITRSRVRGSSAMPAAVVSGTMGGFDMISRLICMAADNHYDFE